MGWHHLKKKIIKNPILLLANLTSLVLIRTNKEPHLHISRHSRIWWPRAMLSRDPQYFPFHARVHTESYARRQMPHTMQHARGADCGGLIGHWRNLCSQTCITWIDPAGVATSLVAGVVLVRSWGINPRNKWRTVACKFLKSVLQILVVNSKSHSGC